MGLGDGLAPSLKGTRLHFGADLDGGLGLQVDQRGGDQGANGAVVHDQQTVLVQPVPRKHQELIPVGAARNLVAQQAHEGAALVLAHPSEPQGFAGDLLVVEQGAAAAVERPQRGQFRGIDAQLVAEVAPQPRRHDPERVEQPAAHAQEADVQRQAELVGITSARFDQRALSRAEGEEGLQLEAADVAWQLAHAQVRRLPALHRARLTQVGRARYASQK